MRSEKEIMTRKAFFGLLVGVPAAAGVAPRKASAFPAEDLSKIRRKLERGEYTINQARAMLGLNPVAYDDRSHMVAQMRRVEAW